MTTTGSRTAPGRAATVRGTLVDSLDRSIFHHEQVIATLKSEVARLKEENARMQALLDELFEEVVFVSTDEGALKETID